ncbi:M23 family metallopeptidase [Microbacterium sp. 77mftsu3.1]|uniref:M23 family metallopeptidase n=1 Tax=Microbacterium sp. 77mftsu3.1 TaxID=1761802 RepID=UPI00036186BD|nr:M23 family metallopeptidase [Microbacterium sp. 77mftsu3.1]SDG21357.1 Peptidase family M23 [Microbacterium sp. 77mftsu3.1]
MTPTTLDLAEVYGPARTSSNVFWKKSSRYSGGYHRGADYREQNASKTASVVTDVVAILDGTVVYAGTAPGGALGGTVVIKGRYLLRTVYEFHSHTLPAVKVGDKVRSGQRLGRNASWGDDEKWTGRRVKRPGLSITWDGMHDHLVFSYYSDGAWNTSRKVIDPVPFIRRAIAAQQKSKPTPKPAGKPARTPNPEEIEMAATVYVKAKKSDPVYEVKDGFKRQLSVPEWAAIKTAFAAAGWKLPYSSEKLTVEQVNAIPTRAK